MGALDEGNYNVKLVNGRIKFGDFEKEDEILEIEDCVKVLLEGLGEDVNREGLRKTPFRVAKALRDGTRGYRQKVKDIVQGALFPEVGLVAGVGLAGGEGGLVVVRDIDLFSYCESCLLPFKVKCYVGYVPSGQRVVGLSKLSRVADIFAKRLQEPNRLASEICSALQNGIKPAGVAVVLQCIHICFPDFGTMSHKKTVKLVARSRTGVFEDEKLGTWDEFLSLVKLRDVNLADNPVSDDPVWCPLRSCSKTGTANANMVTAVSSMIKSLGEDPLREELLETPSRFVKWLTKFKTCDSEMTLNGYVQNPTPNKNIEQLQYELKIPFWSQCEHHLLPFHGVVHVGYFSSEKVNPVGKSLLQAIVRFHGFKLQVQERLTRQIAETVSPLLGGDIMVVVEADHTCMTSRGIEKCGSNTATIAVLGRFSTDPAARAMFLKNIPESSPAG
jgi:GTP cyclohydrolase I